MHARRFDKSLNATESAPAPSTDDVSWLTFGKDRVEFERSLMERYDKLAQHVLEEHFTTQVTLFVCVPCLGYSRTHARTHTGMHAPRTHLH